MGLFSAFNINATGMTAERYRMDIISENVANANTTRTADGSPYRRKVVSFEEKTERRPSSFSHIFNKTLHEHNGFVQQTGTGVRVSGVYEDHVTEMNITGLRPLPSGCGRERLCDLPQCEHHHGDDQYDRCQPRL